MHFELLCAFTFDVNDQVVMDNFGALIEVWKVDNLCIAMLLLLFQLLIQIAAPAWKPTNDVLIKPHHCSLVQVGLDLTPYFLKDNLCQLRWVLRHLLRELQ